MKAGFVKVGRLTDSGGQGNLHSLNKQALISLKYEQHKPCKDCDNSAIKIAKTKRSKQLVVIVAKFGSWEPGLLPLEAM
jgi:hypothetical protein